MDTIYIRSNKQRCEIHGDEYRRLTTLITDFSAVALKMTGSTSNSESAALNAAIAIGSPTIQFLVQLRARNGNSWIQGSHRKWCSRIIRLGLHKGILRRTLTAQPATSTGWQEFHDLLQQNDRLSVVTATSRIDDDDEVRIAHDRSMRIGHDNIRTEPLSIIPQFIIAQVGNYRPII